MYLVVGLGNPGSRYALTPHNVGFMVCDLLSFSFNFQFTHSNKFKGYISDFLYNGHKIIVLKPDTYMNLSGESVYLVDNFYKITKENIIVVQDDIDMEFGRLKIKKNSSSGGHRGIESIISKLGTQDFIRVKIGVGKAANPREHVLSVFEEEKLKTLKLSIENAKEAVLKIIDSGLAKAMNLYNNKSVV